MQSGMPRRSCDDTEEQHEEWWMEQREGLDLVWTVHSYEIKKWMRTATSSTRQGLYEKHLRAYTEAKVVEIVGLKTPLQMLETLGTESNHACYRLSKKLNQWLLCAHCGACRSASSQGNHTCEGVEEDKDRAGLNNERERYEVRGGSEEGNMRSKAPRSLKRIKRTRDPKFGVYNTKLIHAHEAWERLARMDIDTEELSADLASHRIVWKNPKADMGQISAIYPVIAAILPQEVSPVLVHSDSTTDFIVTVGVYRLLESLTTPMTDWDDTPTRPATLDRRVLKSIISAISPSSPSHNEPLLFASCGRPACDYMPLKRDFDQHVYADGTKPQYRLSVKQVARNFVELPVCVQLRLWTAHRNKSDSFHKDVPISIINWQARGQPKYRYSDKAGTEWRTKGT